MRHLTGHKLCLLQREGGVYNCFVCGQRKTKRPSPPEINYSCASPAPGAQTICPQAMAAAGLSLCLVIALALLCVLAVADQRPAGRRQGGAPPRPAGEPERVSVSRQRHGERAARESAFLLVLRGADAAGEAAPPLAQRRSLALPLSVKNSSFHFHWKLAILLETLELSVLMLQSVLGFFSC